MHFHAVTVPSLSKTVPIPARLTPIAAKISLDQAKRKLARATTHYQRKIKKNADTQTKVAYLHFAGFDYCVQLSGSPVAKRSVGNRCSYSLDSDSHCIPTQNDRILHTHTKNQENKQEIICSAQIWV